MLQSGSLLRGVANMSQNSEQLLREFHSSLEVTTQANETKTRQKKTRKRKRGSHNPLAQARKKDDKAESLWHRKTGAGFRLFAEFYATQPIGVCSEGIRTSCHTPSSPSKAEVLSQGQSRASKRRKKKKGKYNDQGSNELGSKPKVVGTPLIIADARGDERLLHVLKDLNDESSHIYNFMKTLAKPLPLTFRIRRNVPEKEVRDIRNRIEQDFGDLVAPTAFDDSIYQAKPSFNHLSKANLTELCPALKDFLVLGSLNGTLARQELASMLPVLALSRGGGGWLSPSNCRVLDLCASPGSKMLQVLEIIGGTKIARIRANDVNASRLDSLRDAVERSGIALGDDSVTKYSNMDASQFPVPKNPKKLFDTVICDVPCSGDGTIRKDSHILPNWTPATGNSLHILQLKILLRALQCLKIGGVVSYSTCSLNPIEDEAVVASALSHFRKESKNRTGSSQDKDFPAVGLVPWPEMKGLKYRPGVTKWRVADYVGDTELDDDEKVRLRWYATYQDAEDAGMGKAYNTMWPPSDAETLRLDRCIRLWPQENDSGGFFVALIRRNW